MTLSPEQQRQIIALKQIVVDGFDSSNWTDLGLRTGCHAEVTSHPRLLRSLGWADSDYEGHALDMLVTMVSRDPSNMEVIESYIDSMTGGEPLPSTDGKKRVTFTPTVFNVPNEKPDPKLVAVMMPFGAAFAGVHQAIKDACTVAGLSCQRVDDIWQDSTLIDDIFGLIWRSSIVVCDFTGRNPNVFYECGIAHTLGKHVVPITQSSGDVPFDVQHHRFLQYLNNGEGLKALQDGLEKRLRTLAGQVQ